MADLRPNLLKEHAEGVPPFASANSPKGIVPDVPLDEFCVSSGEKHAPEWFLVKFEAKKIPHDLDLGLFPILSEKVSLDDTPLAARSFRRAWGGLCCDGLARSVVVGLRCLKCVFKGWVFDALDLDGAGFEIAEKGIFSSELFDFHISLSFLPLCGRIWRIVNTERARNLFLALSCVEPPTGDHHLVAWISVYLALAFSSAPSPHQIWVITPLWCGP